MIDTDTLLRQAENFLDTNQFKQAVQLIEHIINREGPDPLTLAWLALAHGMDHLVFLDALMDQYPENHILYLEKITHLLQAGSSGVALWFCSEAIETFKSQPHIEMRFRSLRLSAAQKAQDDRCLADDFLALWQFHTSEQIRLHLMQGLLSISDPQLKSVFSTLIDSGVFPEEIQTLFRQKLEQFALFEKLFPNS